jgi:hypothetical protein
VRVRWFIKYAEVVVLDQPCDIDASVGASYADALAGDHDLAVFRHAALRALGAGWRRCWNGLCCPRTLVNDAMSL